MRHYNIFLRWYISFVIFKCDLKGWTWTPLLPPSVLTYPIIPSSWQPLTFTSRCGSVRNFDWAQMAGNSSKMTVAPSKPQDSVSGAREPDTATAPIWTRLGLPASWNRSSFTRRLVKLFCYGPSEQWVLTDSCLSSKTDFWVIFAPCLNRLCFTSSGLFQQYQLTDCIKK